MTDAAQQRLNRNVTKVIVSASRVRDDNYSIIKYISMRLLIVMQ